eukprot:scaffold12659_cov52-Phaeocystis_antarctica.AAC.1
MRCVVSNSLSTCLSVARLRGRGRTASVCAVSAQAQRPSRLDRREEPRLRGRSVCAVRGRAVNGSPQPLSWARTLGPGTSTGGPNHA